MTSPQPDTTTAIAASVTGPGGAVTAICADGSAYILAGGRWHPIEAVPGTPAHLAAGSPPPPPPPKRAEAKRRRRGPRGVDRTGGTLPRGGRS